MKKNAFEFLKTLLETPSPSGFEAPAQAVVRRYMERFCQCVRSDLSGNLIGVLNENGRPRVMLAGHVDHIGLMIQYVSDEGFLYFDSIGGVDVGLLPGQKVLIHTASGPVPGVVGKKPIHVMEREEKQKPPKIEQLWIDIGARNKKEALRLVSVGDPVTFSLGIQRLKNDFVVGSGFDDKIGSFVVAESLRRLAGKKFPAAVFAVSTVQEELGIRGARTSAFGIEPDIGIAVDVGLATDHPDIDRRKIGEAALGKGPIVYKGANVNPVLGKMVLDVARRERIPVQVKGAPGATGTDANVIQVSRSGVATALVCVANRYMHTPVEMVSLKDLELASRLVAAVVMNLTGKENFIP